MKPFQFAMTVAKAEHDETGYYLRGVSSTTDLDRQQDIMAPSALADMEKYVGQIPLTDSHTNEIGNEIGTLIEAKVQDGRFETVFKLDADDPQAMRLYSKIAKGSHCGFSVGGRILSTSPGLEKGVRRIIEHVELDHIALTKKPANPSTFAQAFAKALDELITEDETMQDTTIAKDAAALLQDALALLKTESEANLAKIGAKFSAETLEGLKAVWGQLGEIIGMNTVVIGADNDTAKEVDVVPGGDKASVQGDANITAEEAQAAEKSLATDDLRDLIKTAIVENIVPLLKSERASLVNTESTEATTPADEFRAAKSITELRAAFAKRLSI